MKLSNLKTDAAKIEAGDWVSDLSEMGDIRLRVRGLQNAHYRRAMTKAVDAVPRSKKIGGRIDPDEMDKLTSVCLATTVLMDWDGLEDENGDPLPFSRDRALELLSDPNFRRFREAVIEAASQVGQVEAEATEEEEGNSPSS